MTGLEPGRHVGHTVGTQGAQEGGALPCPPTCWPALAQLPWDPQTGSLSPSEAGSACETRPHIYVLVCVFHVHFLVSLSHVCVCLSVSLCVCLSPCACSESSCVLVFVLLSKFLSAFVSLCLCLSLALSFISKCVPWSLCLSHPVRGLVTPFSAASPPACAAPPPRGSLSRLLLRLWLLWRLLRRSSCLCCSPSQTPAARAEAAALLLVGQGQVSTAPAPTGVPR